MKPKVIGSACWSVGAPGHRGVAVAPGEARQGRLYPVQFLADQIEGVAQLQNQRGVDDVLGRGTPVHVAAGIARAGLAERLDQGHDRIADQLRALADRPQIEAGDIRLRGDLLGRLGRDQPELRLGARERRLDVQHALQARLVGEHGAHRGRREQAAVDRRIER